ncbi:MAG: hypothetical protein COB04_15715 [Gammaproteobacteria bacterium]|nr:MAG: hypothetical protein COB04_15715 [Gammaproteobacteria bacterium]
MIYGSKGLCERCGVELTPGSFVCAACSEQAVERSDVGSFYAYICPNCCEGFNHVHVDRHPLVASWWRFQRAQNQCPHCKSDLFEKGNGLLYFGAFVPCGVVSFGWIFDGLDSSLLLLSHALAIVFLLVGSIANIKSKHRYHLKS